MNKKNFKSVSRQANALLYYYLFHFFDKIAHIVTKQHTTKRRLKDNKNSTREPYLYCHCF
jgi:hypothetical protein